MQVPANKSRVVRFGVFEVDLQEAELRKSGIRLKLQEQPFQILTMLLERPGQTVTREELQRRLWPADTFVDFDHSLNSSIKKLREALGDNSENPRFIETLHRRGYRFIAPVDGARASAAGQTELPSEPAQPVPAARADWKQAARWWKWTAVVVLAVLAVLLGLWLRSPLPPPRVIASQELTNDGLLKESLVTDGSRIYFLENSNTAARIAQVSVTGGDTAPVDVPIAYPNVLDASGERSELLISENPNPLNPTSSFWSMPLPAGSANRTWK
jgi:DNA-binding winged helix-turn-helix (wHTH) protein